MIRCKWNQFDGYSCHCITTLKNFSLIRGILVLVCLEEGVVLLHPHPHPPWCQSGCLFAILFCSFTCSHHLLLEGTATLTIFSVRV